jgi:atypical dual specificity phosphatase
LRKLDFVIEGVLAGCSRPFVKGSGESDAGHTNAPDDDLETFKRHGIAAIVSLTPTPLDCDAVARAGFEYLHLPVPDFAAPKPAEVKRFVEFVRSARDRGRGAVAVHCGSGLGRTGTMLACFLVSEGRSAAGAIAEVRRLRPGSVETDEQEAAVRAWEKDLSPRRHGGSSGGVRSRRSGR